MPNTREFKGWKETYKGNQDWLPKRTIFLSLHGSKAYGTSTPESDTDFRGVCIPPKSFYLGTLADFEQAEQKEPDLTIFELKKFLRLATDANPNVIEILFTLPEHHFQVLPLGEKLLENRNLFLSKKIKQTFSGYAISQLRRMEKHMAHHRNPLKGPPSRKDYGLPDKTLIPSDQLSAANSAIQKKMDTWNVDFIDELDKGLRIDLMNKISGYLSEVESASNTETWIGAARTLGYNDNFIEILDKERRFTAKQREWEQYVKWKAERNPARASLEAKHGVDLKHAYHLVRLLRTCKEVLETGILNVYRPDREELLAIRNGSMSAEAIIEYAKKEDEALWQVMRDSKLPTKPDTVKISALCMEMIEESFRLFGD